MKLTTENSNTTTKWRAPYIVHYIRDSERFRTQLLSEGPDGDPKGQRGMSRLLAYVPPPDSGSSVPPIQGKKEWDIYEQERAMRERERKRVYVCVCALVLVRVYE